MIIYHPIIKKIKEADVGTYVIFFSYGCPYSMKALDLLKEKGVKYKGYDISTIKNGLPKLLEVLNENLTLVNFKPKHRTKPIIFLNNQLIGGYNELYDHFAHG
jgi:glutaredoxin